ncbi:MAG: XcyI family restriction endonuclease [Candidatus Scalindua sp.]|nr:XcyI family restriction endonuclease [Candidatus Scalindua sp.]
MQDINIPAPELQIDFSFAIGQIRSVYLQDALSKAVDKIDLPTLDNQLAEYVPQSNLKALAKRGLRGELVFPAPCMLEADPFLLGYYRLLLGFSQKEFYTKRFGVSGFKSMEVKGTLSATNQVKLSDLCKGMVGSACALLDGIGIDRVSKELLDDLTLLTVGPQLRGGANVKKGVAGIVDVFESIHGIVKHAATKSTSSKIQIINAADRKVFIEFAPDPDIVIREEMNTNSIRNVIAIEVKGGTDFSNIHNRVGEAEKSHQKAKADGYVECWTVVNVDRIDMDMARRESPSTNRFYRISALKSGEGGEYEDFKNRGLNLLPLASYCNVSFLVNLQQNIFLSDSSSA